GTLAGTVDRRAPPAARSAGEFRVTPMTGPSCRGLLAVSLVVAIAGQARTQTWTGAAAPDANWSNPGNWTGGVPVSSANTQLTFPVGTTDPVQDLAASFALNRITLAGSFARTITGGGMDFRASGGSAATIEYD